MKKLFSIMLAIVLVVGAVAVFAGCNKEAEIAVVTDVGSLKDGGFNQGTWEGAKAYAKANGKSVQYYQPANKADATDQDRVAAMEKAIANGAKVIVAPGFLQAAAMSTVAASNPDVKFIFIDGWPLADADGKLLTNVTAVSYKEEESGYMAGYAAVMEGYTKLGGTFGGGGTNPACNRFSYGYVQGANAAAKAKNVDKVDIKISFQYGESFSASNELATQIAGWYASGTQVVFSCGGSMFESVKQAAEETADGKIIGVDVDQAKYSERVITSAVKGLSESVELILGKFYAGKWDAELGGKLSNLGASEDATGLPTAKWRTKNFTIEQYQALLKDIKDGKVIILTAGTDAADGINNTLFWAGVDLVLLNANITLEK